jgi:hypothetical protein
MTITTTTTQVVISENTTMLDASAEAVIAKFNETKAALKALEAQKDELDAQLRAMLLGNEIGMINGVERVRIVHRNTSKIDRKALQSAWPEAYEATLVESPYTVLQAK